MGQFIRFIAIIIVRIINYFLLERFKIKKGINLVLATEWKKTKLLFKYKFCGFFSYKGIQMPKQGYFIFPIKIKEALIKNNIYSMTDTKVDEISIDSLNVFLKIGNKEIAANKVFLTESSDTNILDLQISKKSNYLKEYPHTLIRINPFKKNKLKSYIQIKGDKLFQRVQFFHHHRLEQRKYYYSLWLCRLMLYQKYQQN